MFNVPFVMKILAYYLTLVILFTQIVTCFSKLYDVHWLSGATTIERDALGVKQAVDIYCYRGPSKSVLCLWQTVKFHIRIKNDEYREYVSGNPDEVYNQYTESSYGWNVNPFQSKRSKSISLDLFNTTCLAINTKQMHAIELQIIRIDLWRVLLMGLGIALIFSSRALSGNPFFFYLCGILVGVCASFMVLVYYVSKLLPRKTFMYGVLIGGWTVGVFMLQQIWENMRTIILTYQAHMFWYTFVVGFVSFLVCYKIGPPRNQRSQNLVMWTLQVVGVLMAFFSSDYQEASASIVIIAVALKYFPESILRGMKSCWHRRFPPKQKLLSNEEYYEEGARETKNALDNLRKYCSSPDCAQWKIMLKLNNSKRFASFVEGDSHLSDDEVLGYESYAFATDRRKSPRFANSTVIANSTTGNVNISDDDSSGSEDEY